MSLQKLFEKEVKDAAEAKGFNVAHDRAWGNVGTFRLMEGFDVKAVIHYQFNDGYASVSCDRGAAESSSNRNKSEVGSSYIDFSKNQFAPFMVRVLAFIKGLDTRFKKDARKANRRAVKNARAVVKAFQQIRGKGYENEGIREIVIDLVSDLMLLPEIDAAYVMRCVSAHNAAESKEENFLS